MKKSEIHKTIVLAKQHIIPLTPQNVFAGIDRVIDYLAMQRETFLKSLIAAAMLRHEGPPPNKNKDAGWVVVDIKVGRDIKLESIEIEEMVVSGFSELILSSGVTPLKMRYSSFRDEYSDAFSNKLYFTVAESSNPFLPQEKGADADGKMILFTFNHR